MKIDIEESINRAINFIFLSQKSDGSWKDFKSHTRGESIYWVSSYVGLSLLQAGIPKSKLELTAKSILNRQSHEYGGWGYHEKVIPDADSTANVILFLSNFGYKEEINNRAVDFLLKHKKSSGGFSTFLKSDNLENEYKNYGSIDGWCQDISDVTAISILALKQLNLREKIQDSIKYLIKSQETDGRWKAYWWNDDIYATAYVIEALKDENKATNSIIKAQKWLLSRCLNLDIPFYIALCLQGILINSKEEYKKTVEKCIRLLLSYQLSDGSFKSYTILRIPYSSNIDPWNNKKMIEYELYDNNRVFTTATCLKALCLYKNYI